MMIQNNDVTQDTSKVKQQSKQEGTKQEQQQQQTKDYKKYKKEQKTLKNNSSKLDDLLKQENIKDTII